MSMSEKSKEIRESNPDLGQDDSVAVVDLADELRIRKQWIFKIIKRLGIITNKRRGELVRGNQKVATISNADAMRIREYINQSKSSVQDVVNSHQNVDGMGVFYLIQLEPDFDQGRFKVGFATDLEERLRKHRCSSPLLRCIKSWPCRSTWERAAIDCVSNECERIHTEVFRSSSIEEVVARADKFFGMMPKK